MAIIKIRNAAIDLDAAEIPNLPATKITSGTFDNARISLDAAEIPNLDTAKITTGTLADARVPNLNASKITAGTIATARLGSGTASSSTFLRGDNTFAAAGGTNTPNFRAFRSSAQSFSASTNTTVVFNATSFDSASAFNTSNGKFTVPSGQGGKYCFTTSLRLNNSSVNNEVAIYFFVGSSEKSFSNKTVGGNYPTVIHSDILSLSAGNEVIVKIYTNVSSPVLDSNANALYTTFEGFKLAE